MLRDTLYVNVYDSFELKNIAYVALAFLSIALIVSSIIFIVGSIFLEFIIPHTYISWISLAVGIWISSWISMLDNTNVIMILLSLIPALVFSIIFIFIMGMMFPDLLVFGNAFGLGFYPAFVLILLSAMALNFLMYRYWDDEENPRIHDSNKGQLEKMPSVKQTYDPLAHFETLNVTTKSIYDLGRHRVLIILKDGTNLTNWDDVKSKRDIIFLSEDLSCETSLENKYKDLSSLRLVVVRNASDKIKSTYSMFLGCKSLVDIKGFETWNTSNLESMKNMFGECSALASCDCLKDLDVSNVRDMTALFNECSSLSDIAGLRDWDVSNVTNMWSLFADTAITSVEDLANWDVSNVTNMCSLFTGCTNLKSLIGLESWDVSNVEDMGSIFWGNKSLKDISALRTWNTSKLTKLSRSFWNCKNLNDIGALSQWDVSNVTDMVYLFVKCTSLKDLTPLRDWDVSNVMILRSMFDGCKSIKTLDGLQNWNLESTITVERMFDGCRNLHDVSALESWSISESVNSGGIFNGCPLVDKNSPKTSVADNDGPLNIDSDFKFLKIYGSGWCLVKLVDIYSRASFLRDVPGDCLKSIIKALKNDEDFHVDFEAEGWQFEVRADSKQCYFNFKDGEKHSFDTINKYDLALAIERDIKSDISSWQGWSGENLDALLDELKELNRY